MHYPRFCLCRITQCALSFLFSQHHTIKIIQVFDHLNLREILFHQRRDRRTLIAANFKQKPAAGGEVMRRRSHNAAVEAEPVRAAFKRKA